MSWLLLAIIIVSTTAGEVLQAMGMRRHGEIHDFRPGALGRAAAVLARGWQIPVAIFSMAISFFAFMSLLSTTSMSFAVPATAASAALETALAKFLLKETIGWRRWLGAGLVVCGVALLRPS